ncbi:phosphotransferase [Haloferula sp. BvORR071]|uniref:phosphotransferase n=1 Tax=Haloferula sp. BvORR071 TaxID=1396141 RepID=UPI000556741A|nr:phosphotransferase [Haloferula sp. BvORR071]
MPTDAILHATRQYLGIDPTVTVTMTPIKKGASGRTIVRVKTPGRDPFIGIHWTDDRPDSDNFLPVAKFLKATKINVPEIFHEIPHRRVALVQDLGDIDLYSLKDAAFEEREPYYRSALQQIDKLFYSKGPKDFELMPPFDETLYRWEQEYFFEHLVEGLLGMEADELREGSEFSDLAKRLGASAKHLVHRDFQSQNLLLHEDKAWWIDFQGMRRGRQEYDIASLVYDPYMDHSEEDREKILDIWEDISEDRPEETIFRQCAAQRLMQALGAFGNIIRNRSDEWYAPHVPVAARFLAEVTAGTPLEKPLAPVLAKARDYAP